MLVDVSSNSRSHLANSCLQAGMPGCCVYIPTQRENTSQAICNYSHVRFSMTFLSTRIQVPFCFNQPCRHAQSRWVFPIIQVTLPAFGCWIHRLVDSVVLSVCRILPLLYDIMQLYAPILPVRIITGVLALTFIRVFWHQGINKNMSCYMGDCRAMPLSLQ